MLTEIGLLSEHLAQFPRKPLLLERLLVKIKIKKSGFSFFTLKINRLKPLEQEPLTRVAMAVINPNLPQVGDAAPSFEFQTPQGLIRFPDYSRGFWCVFFAHPANFTSAWKMFSAFLAKKERWLNERNSKALALSTVPISQNDWSDKARRFIGIHLRAPVLEDLDFRLANVYGMASGRRIQQGRDRLALIIDPEGIIRFIITRPLMPDIESALQRIEIEFDRLQGNLVEDFESESLEPIEAVEQSDATGRHYKAKPAHFQKKKIFPN